MGYFSNQLNFIIAFQFNLGLKSSDIMNYFVYPTEKWSIVEGCYTIYKEFGWWIFQVFKTPTGMQHKILEVGIPASDLRMGVTLFLDIMWNISLNAVVAIRIQ